jgi:hypothetical protein
MKSAPDADAKIIMVFQQLFAFFKIQNSFKNVWTNFECFNLGIKKILIFVLEKKWN